MKREKRFINRAVPYKNHRQRALARVFLEVEQDGRCAICGTGEIRLVIDHDHHTGLIRGLLCNSCNVGLGLFKEHPMILTRAMQYLGWEAMAGAGPLIPRCSRCNRRLAGYVEGRWSIRCKSCKKDNIGGGPLA